MRRIHLRHLAQRCGGGRLDPGTVVFRCGAAQRLQRQVGLDLAALADPEPVLGDGVADDGEVEVPLVEDRLGLRFPFGLEHHQHPLLALRQHHLVGAHRLLAAGHRVEVQFDPEAALVAHLDRRAGQPGSTHVLDRDHRARRHQLQARLQQPLLGERVADLHGWAFLMRVVGEFGRGHGRPADPVAPGLGAEIDHRHADAGGGGVEDLVGIGQPGGEGVDQAVAVIGGVKTHLAADGRHAEAVAVAADPGHHTGDQRPGLRMLRIAEAQRVHRRDRARAHGEDIAQDAADPGRRALIGLDIGGVVVALHLEHHRLPITNIDDAGILARAADHLRAGGRQGAQPFLRGFVGTMLVPHGREDAEFGEARRPAQKLQDALVFVRLQAMAGGQFLGDVWLWFHEFPRRRGRTSARFYRLDPGIGSARRPRAGHHRLTRDGSRVHALVRSQYRRPRCRRRCRCRA